MSSGSVFGVQISALCSRKIKYSTATIPRLCPLPCLVSSE